MAEKKVGNVIHYYNKIGVAIVELDSVLKTGDMVKFVRGGEDVFEQEVETMQVDHKNVSSAKKGDTIGMKTTKEIKEGAEVFKT